MAHVSNAISKEAEQSEDTSHVKELVKEYKDRFEGIGKLTDIQVDLNVDPDFKPVAQPPHQQPLSVREKMEEEIQHLLDQDIIKNVNEPTGWVSPPVVTPKKDQSQIRLKVDMRVANQEIPRQAHPALHDRQRDHRAKRVDRVLTFGYGQRIPPISAQREFEKCNDLFNAHWPIPIQEAELRYEVCS